jgi:hypothetical protein
MVGKSKNRPTTVLRSMGRIFSRTIIVRQKYIMIFCNSFFIASNITKINRKMSCILQTVGEISAVN